MFPFTVNDMKNATGKKNQWIPEVPLPASTTKYGSYSSAYADGKHFCLSSNILEVRK